MLHILLKDLVEVFKAVCSNLEVDISVTILGLTECDLVRELYPTYILPMLFHDHLNKLLICLHGCLVGDLLSPLTIFSSLSHEVLSITQAVLRIEFIDFSCLVLQLDSIGSSSCILRR